MVHLTKLLFHTNRKLYLTYGMVLFGNLDRPLKASRGFVSISWATCFTLWHATTKFFMYTVWRGVFLRVSHTPIPKG